MSLVHVVGCKCTASRRIPQHPFAVSCDFFCYLLESKTLDVAVSNLVYQTLDVQSFAIFVMDNVFLYQISEAGVETEGFGGSYPSGNTVCIRDWSFMDLNGKKYTPLNGSMEVYKPHKMVWTRAENGVLAPFYLPSKKQQVNVKVCASGDTACCTHWGEKEGVQDSHGFGLKMGYPHLSPIFIM